MARSESGHGVESREVLLAGRIPATIIHVGELDARNPVVLFSNGFGARRAEAVPPGLPANPISPPLVRGLLAARHNILVVDNPAHGDRLAVGETTKDAVLASFGANSPSDVLNQAVAETASLLDSAIEMGLIGESAPIVAIGHSWGGLHSILRLLGDSRISGAVALIPVVEPTCLFTTEERADTPLLDQFSLGAAIAAGLCGRPLLLVAGSEDIVAPAAYCRQLVDRLEGTPGTEAFRYAELPGLGHGYDRRLLDLTLGWLAEPQASRVIA